MAGNKRTKIDSKYYAKSIFGIILMFGFQYLPPIQGITSTGMQILGIFFGLLYLWSAVEIAWPSILGVIAFGMSDYSTMNNAIMQGLGSPVVWQLMMVMLIAGAINVSGVGEFLARWTISRKFVNGRPLLFSVIFLYGFFIVAIISSAFACMFLAWTVIYSIADMVGYKKGDKYISMMLIYTIMACGLGEFIIPFKGWQLALCLSFNDVSGTVLSYSYYILISFIIGSIMVISMGLSTKYIFKADLTKLQNFDASVLRDSKTEKLNYRQKSYFYTFIFIIVSTVATTIMPSEWGIVKLFNMLTPSGVFALAVVILCMVKIDGEPLMKFNDVAKEGIKWEIILICTSILPLASALTAPETGIVQLCTSVFEPMLAGKSGTMVITIIVLATLIGTNIGSNTGIALLIIPIAIPIAMQMGLDLEIMGIAVIYTACMGFVLPGSSALSAVGYTNDWVTPKEMMKYTIFACIVYAVAAIPIYCVINLL